MLSNHTNLLCEGKQINTNSGIYEKYGIPTTSSGLVNSTNTGAKVISQRIFDKTLRIPCYTTFPKAVIEGSSEPNFDDLSQDRTTSTPYITASDANKSFYVLITHFLDDHFNEEAVKVDFKYKSKDTLSFTIPMEYDITRAAAMYYDEWTLSYNDGGPTVDAYIMPLASVRMDSEIYTLHVFSFQAAENGEYHTLLLIGKDSIVFESGQVEIGDIQLPMTVYTKYPAATDTVWFASNFEQVEFLFNFESSGDVSDYIDAKMNNALKDFSNYFCVR